MCVGVFSIAFASPNGKKCVGLGMLLQVKIAEKCMALRREAHVEVKIAGSRDIFDVPLPLETGRD